MNKTIYTKEHRALVKSLKNTRLSLKLTQLEMAKKLGVTQSYISKLEAGQRKIDLITLGRIARILKKDITNFF